jgi:hypothetical protein
MAAVGKAYIVEDADTNAGSNIPPGIFRGTLQRLLDALDAARYRSVAGTPKALIIAEGKRRQIIRRSSTALRCGRRPIQIRGEHLRRCQAVLPGKVAHRIGTIRFRLSASATASPTHARFDDP